MAPVTTPASLLPLLALTPACLVAAWLDIRYRRIPNWLCAATVALGLVGAYVSGGFTAVASNGLHMLAALIGGMILFKFRMFGGGDAKFYAACAAWFPLARSTALLMMVALSGLALLILWFTYRRLAGHPLLMKGGTPYDGLPYGVAIGAGAIAAMLL